MHEEILGTVAVFPQTIGKIHKNDLLMEDLSHLRINSQVVVSRET